jgi:uncharacterized metal-binding protein YceD (DUF177 family)
MKPVKTEFSRPLRVDRVPEVGSVEEIAAEPEELVRLAQRLGLPGMAALSASLQVDRARGGGVHVRGHLAADLTQTCVVTLEDFPVSISVPVDRYYMPASVLAGDEHPEDEDIDPIENGEIDLGELVAETLALSLDPYPRKPGVAFLENSATGDEESETQMKPFAELARLRRDSGPAQ